MLYSVSFGLVCMFGNTSRGPEGKKISVSQQPEADLNTNVKCHEQRSPLSVEGTAEESPKKKELRSLTTPLLLPSRLIMSI